MLKFLFDDVFVDVTEILRCALDDIIKSRVFRRELHRKPFIFKGYELPEGLKPVLFEMHYRASAGSLVTNRNKLIELPAEALRLVKQIVY